MRAFITSHCHCFWSTAWTSTGGLLHARRDATGPLIFSKSRCEHSLLMARRAGLLWDLLTIGFYAARRGIDSVDDRVGYRRQELFAGAPEASCSHLMVKTCVAWRGASERDLKSVATSTISCLGLEGHGSSCWSCTDLTSDWKVAKEANKTVSWNSTMGLKRYASCVTCIHGQSCPT